MPNTVFDKEAVKRSIVNKVMRHNGVTLAEASRLQVYKAVSETIHDQMMQKWMISRHARHEAKGKRVYYLSIEYLLGRLMDCNLINLASKGVYKEALDELGISITDLMSEEPEPALGNGGLGRLAACFMDSLASEQLPAMGCTIRYEYGLFRQKIVDGQQVEMPDNWLRYGNMWENAATEDSCFITFGGRVEESEENGRKVFRTVDAQVIEAVPYDMPVVGYENNCVNTLRTWSARNPDPFDLHAFSEGRHLDASASKGMAEVINKVLYPEDTHEEGKSLRLKQQYFMVSATLQYALKQFKKYHGNNFDILPDKAVFHINDTHPALAIPEMMRLLIDQEGLSWEMAERITSRCMAYTNHTVMSEALEKWPESMMKNILPRIYMILEELNKRVCERLFLSYPDQWERIGRMAILAYGQVHMANLCVSMCYSVNGVSQLHGKILCDTNFHDYYVINPKKFSAITNGITHRRWLLSANPALTGLLKETIGDGFTRDASKLEDLVPYAEDAAFREKFAQVKKQNKERLADFLMKRQGAKIDPEFIFDTQSKRLHEYKRQLLNALHVNVLFNRIVEDSTFTMPPRLFLFGAKAAPGYWMAKQIIRYINELAKKIDEHPRARTMLKIVFVENYDVSTAEVLIPATDISEQLSTAGKEASGTGNMKFMMNGAVTLGTMDGANVEIFEQVGEENIYIFGMRSDTVDQLRREGNYRPWGILENNAEIRKVMNQWESGWILPNEQFVMNGIRSSLLEGNNPDQYFVLKDFGSYSMANMRMMEDYQNRDKWLKMAVMNTAKSGFFSSDRTIREYNEKIWRIQKLEG